MARLVKAAVLYTVSYVGSNPTGSTNLDLPLYQPYFHWMEVIKTHVPNLYKEFQHLSPEAVEDLYSVTVDRWTWDTGSEEDRKLLIKLDRERWYRKKNKNQSRKLSARWTVEAQEDLDNQHSIDIEEELVAAVAQDMADELDKEIINAMWKQVSK